MFIRNTINALFLSLISVNAFAAVPVKDFGDVGMNAISTINVWLIVLVAAASLIGIGLMISGGLQLKKHADNPVQNPVSKPLIYLISGIIIFGISATSDTMKETVFGATTKNDTWTFKNVERKGKFNKNPVSGPQKTDRIF